MSRSGYSEDCDDILALGRWRAQVASATRGKRGQKLLKDLLVALDEMSEKRLINGKLKKVSGDGPSAKAEFCALGVLGEKRGLDMLKIDPNCSETVSEQFDIAEPLAREIVYMNDEHFDWRANITPEQRWTEMRAWVQSKIKKEA